MTGCGPAQEGRWVRGGGAELFVRAWEPEERRARIVVVPGLGDHSGRYSAVAESLASRAFAVSAYDPRGHGRSSGRRGHLRSFVTLLRDLERVVDAELRRGPTVPWFLIGHSMGGLVVLRWLQENPGGTAAAVISAPWLATALPVPAWKRALALVLAGVAPGVTLPNEVRPELISRDPDEARRYAEDPLVHDRVSARMYREVLGAQRRALEGGVAMKGPVLFLVPGDDEVADSEVTRRFVESLPEGVAEILLLPGCRHEPFSDIDRRRSYEAIASWLEGHLDREHQTA